MSDIGRWVRHRHVAAFYLIFLLVVCSLSYLFRVSVGPLLVRHRFPVPREYHGGIVMAASFLIASAIYRLLGLSLASKAVEGRARVDFPGAESGGIPEIVEIDTPSTVKFGLIMLTFWAMLISMTMCCGGPNALVSFAGLIGIPLFGVMTIAGISRFREPRVRADRGGILGTHTTTFGRRFVPWGEVATCEITRVRDQLGNEGGTSLVFKDWGGGVRLKIDLKGVPEARIGPLLKFIRARLPKAEFDPLDEL